MASSARSAKDEVKVCQATKSLSYPCRGQYEMPGRGIVFADTFQALRLSSVEETRQRKRYCKKQPSIGGRGIHRAARPTESRRVAPGSSL